MAKKNVVSEKDRAWIEARRKFQLSHAHIQMARELGMNPKKLGGLANHRQEPWKAPLPDFIVACYEKRFGKDRPDLVRSVEEAEAAQRERKQQKKLEKQQAKSEQDEEVPF